MNEGSPPTQIIDIVDPDLGKIGMVVIDQPVRGVTAGGCVFLLTSPHKNWQ